MSRRDVIVHAAAPWRTQLMGVLAEAGWRPLALGEFTDLPGERRQDVHVGVVRLGRADDAEIDALDELMASRPEIEWVALVPTAALPNPRVGRFLRHRCFDFHTLPIDTPHFLATLGHAEGKARLPSGGAAGCEAEGCCGMIGHSPAMRDLYAAIRKASAVEAPVMISGESGTGKELVARAIHQLSPRRDGPFIAVNCAALPANLIQAELFGHEKGAFTGAYQRKIGRLEAAAGGTIFLDEIGDLPLEMQVTLLHVLQDKVIERLGSNREIRLDVRVIAASHVELEQAVADAHFRADLYYRINVIRLRTPALRDREEDVERLARAYLERFLPESRGGVRGFSRQALTVMANYEWPGNVRELINRVRQAVVLSENRLLTPRDLGLEKRVSSEGFMTLEEARSRAEHDTIRRALRRNQNNVAAAARQLGISRATLYRLLVRVSHAGAAVHPEFPHAVSMAGRAD
ncbi:sigma-54 dependent transcriptional regulator [Thiobacillus sedimenti]|uniref:Sigma-54 dependent transcriptional regulator n=1 Tax=Thiobacillus sedimenti TaxID=3110231 RepID=A0ABZ1CJK4_9PROT|nr:sigma-54 dependent transcriptional regulator [Thiobacillus sp. SCUT-2]WRS39572.1 sigma-54 dependent transcriptional regulator [Thiobacillus sp. SCUT-2]